MLRIRGGIIMGAMAFAWAAWAERVHIVQKNETLGGIASRYEISLKVLQLTNGLANPNHLVSGKKLIIPGGAIKEIPYVVKAGESLSLIAAKYGMSTSKLANHNGIAKPNLIRAGQKLMIPLGKVPSLPPLLSATIRKELDRTTPRRGKWIRIVIHHTATNVDDAMNIHRVHKIDNGWKNGLAYHFVISNGSRKAKDGEIHIGGRWKDQQDGGHVKRLQWNRESIGICLIGNFETRKPTAAQLKSLEGLCRYLKKRTGITNTMITTHKKLHPGHTACPGKYFPYDSFIKRLALKRPSS